MNWTRVSNSYHLLLPSPPKLGEHYHSYGSLGSVQEMTGHWWKARVFARPGQLDNAGDMTHRFEYLADAKAWVAVTCKLGK